MNLPPLIALRAFESFGRLGSVKLAAQELGVTPGAVSQHLDLLARHFGLPLTRKDGRGLALSRQGKILFADCEKAFGHLRKICLDLAPGKGRARFLCAAPEALDWCAEELRQFSANAPMVETDLEERGLEDPAQSAFHDADLVLSEGPIEAPGFTGQALFENRLVAVAHARFHEGFEARALLSIRLLHRPDLDHWRDFLALIAPEEARRKAALGARFSTPEAALEAAARGEGAALANPRTQARDLASLGLAPLPAGFLRTGESFFIFWRSDAPADSALALLRDWLIARQQEQKGQEREEAE